MQLHTHRESFFQKDTYYPVFLLPSKFITYLVRIFYRPFLVKYLSKERQYVYAGTRMVIPPDVFHPGFFFSTRLLLKYMKHMSLQGKTLLEPGAGSGLISITAAKAGASVTATDINPVAVEYLLSNAKANQVPLTVIESDLFTAIPQQVFDIIVINPPYYFKQPVSHKERAWFCGKEGEYFQQLFAQIGNYTDENTVTLMILCEGSERDRIQAIAMQAGWQLQCVHRAHNLLEKNYIYRVRALNTGTP
jgi:release factor glutamine methyltransferase